MNKQILCAELVFAVCPFLLLCFPLTLPPLSTLPAFPFYPAGARGPALPLHIKEAIACGLPSPWQQTTLWSKRDVQTAGT